MKETKSAETSQMSSENICADWKAEVERWVLRRNLKKQQRGKPRSRKQPDFNFTDWSRDGWLITTSAFEMETDLDEARNEIIIKQAASIRLKNENLLLYDVAVKSFHLSSV